MTVIQQIKLRPTEINDLETLFEFQLDEDGRHMAAFMGKDSQDKAAYVAKWTKLLADPGVHQRTILVGDTIAGTVAKFIMHGDAEITYWIDRKFWGKGIASAALREFLKVEKTRPIFGRVVFDNVGSQKVLERSGFVKTGTDKGFASARQREVEEFIYELK